MFSKIENLPSENGDVCMGNPNLGLGLISDDGCQEI